LELLQKKDIEFVLRPGQSLQIRDFKRNTKYSFTEIVPFEFLYNLIGSKNLALLTENLNWIPKQILKHLELYKIQKITAKPSLKNP